MRMVFVLLLSIVVLSAGNVKGRNLSKKRSRMIRALQTGNPAFFTTIKYKAFIKINTIDNEKATVIMKIGEDKKLHPKMINAMLGAFRNRDIKLRTAVYYELANLAKDKKSIAGQKLGPRSLKAVKKRAAQQRERSKQARIAIKELRRQYPMSVYDYYKVKNHRALASMDPLIFKETNAGTPDTCINSLVKEKGSRGISAYLFFLKSVSYRRGNIVTQKMILAELKKLDPPFRLNEKKRIIKIITMMIKKSKKEELKTHLKELRDSLQKNHNTQHLKKEVSWRWNLIHYNH